MSDFNDVQINEVSNDDKIIITQLSQEIHVNHLLFRLQADRHSICVKNKIKQDCVNAERCETLSICSNRKRPYGV